MNGELIILGCGSSAGVPAIGNWWGKCDPVEPRNRRSRPSIAIKTSQTLLIVDTGPDFREQMNRESLGVPDAVLYTHAHSDHVAGIDELRTFQRLHNVKFPVFSDTYTLEQLKNRVNYMFIGTENGFYPAVCDENTLNFNQIWSFKDINARIFKQDHGTIHSIGLRLGNIGYSTDFKRLDDEAIETLKGVDIWIADGAGHHSVTNPVHASIDEVTALNARIGAKKVYLTHLPPTMDYQTLINELPKGYEPAYDGLRLSIS